MKKRFTMTIALVLVAVLVLVSGQIFAIDYAVSEDATRIDARFNVLDTAGTGAELSMISADGTLIIHITEDTLIYFEDAVPANDDDDGQMTKMVREVLFGRTLAEVLDGRRMIVTYDVQLDSLPSQTFPISIMIMFETIVPLPAGEAERVQVPRPEIITEDLPFVDVRPTDWFYNPVVWAYRNEIMNGVSPTSFAPNVNMTRAMLVTVLWRYAGMPDAGEAGFADVGRDTWYSVAVAWAAENGIVLGYNATTFGTRDYINREQMYTILYRYMNFAGLAFQLDEEMRVQRFADEDDVSDWAIEAIRVMFDAGVMFRYSSTDFHVRPQENAFRGEIAGAMFFLNMHAVSLESIQVGSNYEVGSVTLLANGTEHEPSIHFVHGADSTMSVSGIPFSSWLAANADTIPEIQYAGNIEILVHGQDGVIGDVSNVPESHSGMRVLPITAEDFTDGRANVSIPSASGTYLLLVDVSWSGEDGAFTANRYVFKVTR